MKNKIISEKSIKEIWIKSRFDPNGSYVGTPSDENYKKPVQDADDL